MSRQWLGEIISTVRNEFPEFPAALSFLMLLTPETATELLDQRHEQLTERLRELDAELATEIEGYEMPRVALVESEYLRAVTDAELKWVDGILAGLRDGSFSWSEEELTPPS